MAWTRSFATHVHDANDFSTFPCWNGDEAEPWVQEAQDYVRAFVLSHAVWVLAFRDDGQRLVAVSAFDPRRIDIPLNAPVEHQGWHLQVVALDRQHQGQGLAQVVFAETFAAMREVDPARILVTGNIHKDNSPSFAAAERAGLTRLVPLDEHYWVVLGEVPAAA